MILDDKLYKYKWILKKINEIRVYEISFDSFKLNRMKTAKKLKCLREKMRISQADINKEIGIRVSKQENGFASIGDKFLYNYLSKLFDIAVEIHDTIEDEIWPID